MTTSQKMLATRAVCASAGILTELDAEVYETKWEDQRVEHGEEE